MNLYQMAKDEGIAEAITLMLEKDTDKKIFTMRILNDHKSGLEALVIFDDKSVMTGLISVQYISGKLACRLQGNYI